MAQKKEAPATGENPENESGDMIAPNDPNTGAGAKPVKPPPPPSPQPDTPR